MDKIFKVVIEHTKLIEYATSYSEDGTVECFASKKAKIAIDKASQNEGPNVIRYCIESQDRATYAVTEIRRIDAYVVAKTKNKALKDIMVNPAIKVISIEEDS